MCAAESRISQDRAVIGGTSPLSAGCYVRAIHPSYEALRDMMRLLVHA